MAEFTTSALLEVEVDQRSLQSAKREIEDSIDVNVDTSASGQLSGGGRQRMAEMSRQRDEMLDLDRTRNDLLRELVESSDRGNRSRARSGGGGLALAAGGVAAIAGSLAGIPQALAESLGSLVSGSISPSNLIDSADDITDFVSDKAPATDLISTVGADAVLGSVSVASLLSAVSAGTVLTSVSVGSVLSSVGVGTLIDGAIDIGNYINNPGGSGSPSGDTSPDSDPTGDGGGIDVPNLDPTQVLGGVAAGAGAYGIAKSGLMGAARGGAGLATPVFTGSMLPDDAPSQLDAGGAPVGLRAARALSDRFGAGSDPLTGMTAGADGSATGTTSPTDIGPTTSTPPTVSGGPALEGGDARLATINAQQAEGEALNLNEDDDDDEETVVEDNRTVEVDATFEVAQDERQIRRDVQDELDQFKRQIERKLTRQ